MSHCQQFLLTTDQLGDIQVWRSTKETGLEAVYSNNISAKPVGSSRFLRSAGVDGKLQAVCLDSDNVAYIVEFVARDGHVSKLSVSEKISLSGGLDSVGPIASVSSVLSSSPVCCAAMLVTVDSASANKNCAGRFVLLGMEAAPLFPELVCLPSIHVEYSGAAFQADTRTFSTNSDHYFCTPRGLFMYNGISLNTKLVHSFDSLTKDGKQVERVARMEVHRVHGETEFLVECVQKGSRRLFVLVLLSAQNKYIDSALFQNVAHCARNVASGLFVAVDEGKQSMALYRSQSSDSEERKELGLVPLKTIRVNLFHAVRRADRQL
jgi:hypothetical protein